jgi:membrane-bound lytic murein transglycosylase D
VNPIEPIRLGSALSVFLKADENFVPTFESTNYFVGTIMKIKTFLIMLCIAVIGTMVFSGCGSRLKLTKKPTLAVIITNAPAAPPRTSNGTDSAQISVIVDDADIDSLINGAQFACAHNDFEAAHMLLREALADLKIIQSSDSGWSESEDYYEKYFKEIAGIYSERMPPRFSDSIPEEISVATLHERLAMSLDSIKVPASDSLLLQKILSRKKTTYNFPMTLNDRVYKALYFMSRGRKGPIDRWVVQAYYYVPTIKKMFADSGLPSDLAYLPLIESGFNPLAYSRAHAAGMWQFIASTGNRYGMRKDGWIDERRDFLKSTQGAISYLKKLYNQFGDWHIALAAYNCGENGIANALGRATAKNFWQLKVPRETKNYVPEFIAALIIAKNPQCFGFSQNLSDTFDLDTIQVNDCVNLYTVADSLHISLEALRKINPHILHWCTHPVKQRVTLYLPKGSKERFVAVYGQSPADFSVSWATYRIRSGENLRGVSRHFGVPLDALLSLNNFTKNIRLAAGQEISLPLAAGPNASRGPIIRPAAAHAKHYTEIDVSGMRVIKYKVRSGDCVWSLAQIFRVDKNDLCKWNHISGAKGLRVGSIVTIYKPAGPSVQAPQLAPNPLPHVKQSAPGALAPKNSALVTNHGMHIVYYRVQKGDNLWNIAQSFKVPVKNLTMINNLQPDSTLLPGEVIRVPMTEAL